MLMDTQTAHIDEFPFLMREFNTIEKISTLIVKLKEKLKHWQPEILLNTMNKNLNELDEAVKCSILPFAEPSHHLEISNFRIREITIKQQNFSLILSLYKNNF